MLGPDNCVVAAELRHRAVARISPEIAGFLVAPEALDAMRLVERGEDLDGAANPHVQPCAITTPQLGVEFA